jgi:hypothetical protein
MRLGMRWRGLDQILVAVVEAESFRREPVARMMMKRLVALVMNCARLMLIRPG